MARRQVAIVGMDTVGVALAQALKETLVEGVIVAVDADADRRQVAKQQAKVDRADGNFVNGCRDADLIILNAPLLQLRGAFQTLGEMSSQAIVLALSPVAIEPLRWADEFLPKNAPYLVSHLILHPDMVADGDPPADFFHGAVLCLLATADTHERAIKAGSDLAKLLGVRGYFMDAGEHDALLAMVEGMPGLVAAATLLAATRSTQWEELIPLSGVIFKQATEPLFDPAIDAGDALIQNRAEVLRQLDAFLQALRDVRELVEAGQSEELKTLLRAAATQRIMWLSERPRRPWNDDEARLGPPREQTRFDPLMPGWGMKTKAKNN